MTEPGAPADAPRLAEALNEAGVDYVVVGGVAGNLHGSMYPTLDLDVAYARERANLARMVRALEGMEVLLNNAPADLPLVLDVKSLENGANFTFDTVHGRFDILGHIPGISSYNNLRQDSTLTDIDGVEVRIASIDHLIAMKRAANRPKDKLMVEEYLVIADEQDRQRRENSSAS